MRLCMCSSHRAEGAGLCEFPVVRFDKGVCRVIRSADIRGSRALSSDHSRPQWKNKMELEMQMELS